MVFSEAARLERIGRLRVVGLFSHLSNTSLDDDRAALAKFEEGVILAASAGLRPPLRHIAATNAAIALPEARLGCVRIGIGLYGVSPFDDRTPADLGLRPAMTLRGAVAAVRRVPAGTGVSYGYDYRTPVDTTLALVPLGYADGVPRQASGRGPVVIGGRRFTVAGRIAMDQFVVDVGDHPVSIGDEVVLFGDPTLGVPSARDWRMPPTRSTTRSSRAWERASPDERCTHERPRGGARRTRRRVPVRHGRPGPADRPRPRARRRRRADGSARRGQDHPHPRDRRGPRHPGARAESHFRHRAHAPSLSGGTPLVHVDAYRLGAAVELDDLDIDVAHSAVIVEWGRGVAEYLADAWWEIEISRQTGGRGVDNACGEIAVHTVELDADAPRTVTISRHP